ncbi:MAG TPA: ATP-binding protein [Bacteroidales bacterium]|nr:ATP-binding protein [Bacteroidales bacterium]
MAESIRSPFFNFHRKLFLTIVSLFVLFVVFISIYQYHREKVYRIALLTEQLQSYNNLFYEITSEKGVNESSIRSVLGFLKVNDLRVTVVDFTGKVLYDSEANHPGNHANRPEIKSAMAYGEGVSVRRLSETTGKTFFYTAKRYPNYIIRSSRPYDSLLNKQLQADSSFILFVVTLMVVILFLLHTSTKRMGSTIAQLRDFAETADKNLPLDTSMNFPKNELGEISRYIVGLFQRLKSTRDDLLVEREKLVSHLQSAKEGLAIFTPDKKEIIANNLFIQYLNLISDTPAHSATAIFYLPELETLNHHIQEMQGIRNPVTPLQRQSLQVEKNGRILLIQSILFQDKSFEISINDITAFEEENRLKRQLTQNIAHELKTPVSSIQGYMETILNNPDLPVDKLQSFVHRSYLQSKRLSDLLRDISTLTRLDEAPKLIEKEDVNLLSLVQQVTSEMETEILAKKATLKIDIDSDLVIKGNTSLLYSIFRNLLDNALSYAGDEVEVGINCFRNNSDRCYFSFYDTGVGVAEEHLNRIFERFYRVDKGRMRKLGGTGLGLAIVKNAIQHHGGTISAKNRPEGGLEFVFSLMK